VPVVASGEYSGPFAEAYRAGDTLRRLHEAEIRATLLEGGRFGEFLAREADVLLTAGMSEQLVRVLMQRTQEAIGDLREQLDRGERLGPRIDEVFYWLGQLQERTCGLAERLEQQANARMWWSSVAVSLGGAAMVVVDVAAGGPLAAAPPIGAAVMALSTAAGGQLIFQEVRGLFDRVFR
jgi:hypothetical protein